MILFHVTTKAALKSILNEGIKPYTIHVSRTKGNKGIYFTNRKGAFIVAHYWICWKAKKDPTVVVLKVNVPDEWLMYKTGMIMRYGLETADEWFVIGRIIPPEHIKEVFEYECRRG